MRKTKTVKVPLTDGTSTEELSKAFNQMIGAGAANLTIAWPKYLRIKTCCDQLLKLFVLVAKSDPLSRMPATKDELFAFCEAAAQQHDACFSADLTFCQNSLDKLNPESPEAMKFTEVYNAMKSSAYIKTWIKMCDNLVPYRRHFEFEAQLSKKFVINMGGVEWFPFDFAKIDYKGIFIATSGAVTDMFMVVLHKAYKYSRMIYDELQSPDVDIDQFVDMIMQSMEKLKKRPELRDCGKAFGKIKESVQLLKTNFNGYYRDFTSTGSGTIIMENFVLDVSKSSKNDPVLSMQFMRIIKMYRNSANQNTDPRSKAMLDKINGAFKNIEQGCTNLGSKAETVVDDDVDTSSNSGDELDLPTSNFGAESFIVAMLPHDEAK